MASIPPFLYFIDWKESYVKYGSNLAAPRDSSLFIGERVLIQRIVSKKCLDATFTDKQLVCNTDVITLKPKSKVNSKFYLALLSSKLIGAYIKSNNINLDRNVFPKINTNTLEDLPVPDINQIEKSIVQEIIKLVDQLLQLNDEKEKVKLATQVSQLQGKIDFCENRINEIVYSIYNCKAEEIAMINQI